MKNTMPNLPLYQEANEDKTLLKSLPQNGNTGLWYDKFCNSWENAKFQKEKWIKTVTNRHCGDSDELDRQRNRRWEMVVKLKGQNLCLKTDSPFVTGLGREHPVENGFLWHHTLGVPYLPGSSVKGMVRAWIEQWAEEKEEIDHIFGLKRPTEQPQVGEVVFLDAIPLSSVPLKAEIMTPHYGNYYQKKGKLEAPGDWMSPTPIPFLAVKEGATFHFAIVPRRQSCLETPGESDQSCNILVSESREGDRRSDCGTVIGWLKDALEWIGAGAKTTVGYGRMSVDDPNKERCEKEWREQKQKAKDAKKRDAELAKASPIEREVFKFLDERKDKSTEDHIVVISEVQKSRWEGKDKVEVAKWLEREMKEKGKWKPTSNKPNKDKAHKRTLLVLKWLQGE